MCPSSRSRPRSSECWVCIKLSVTNRALRIPVWVPPPPQSLLTGSLGLWSHLILQRSEWNRNSLSLVLLFFIILCRGPIPHVRHEWKRQKYKVKGAQCSWESLKVLAEWYYLVETHLYGLFLYCFLILKYLFVCIFSFWPCPVGSGELRIEPMPSTLGVRSLATGPPRKSLHGLFLNGPFCLFFIYTV